MNKVFDTSQIKKTTVIINQVELQEFLEKRVRQQGMKIEDLFLVVNARPDEWELEMDTSFGKLKVFARNDCPKNLLLNHKRFPYPEVTKVSARAFNSIGGKASHIIKSVAEQFGFTNKKKVTKEYVN